MSCELDVENSGFHEITLGEDAALSFFCAKKTGRPYPLTGATELTMKFKNADGTLLTKTMTGFGITMVNAGGGEFSVSITDTESALLLKGVRMDLELIADFSATRRKIKFKKALTVQE